jgi:transcriptional regulator with XRE-family HTH domain
VKREKHIRPEKIFGQVLQAIRHERKLSQEQLGFESGYHRTYISLLERGQKSPSLNTIFQLAIALKTTPSEILQRVEARVGNMYNSSDREERSKSK